jgi:protease I
MIMPSLCLAQSELFSAEKGESIQIQGCRVALLIADGYHDHEFWFPYYRLKEAGAEVLVAGPQKGVVYGEGRHGKDGLPAQVEYTIEEIMQQKFDVIYLPGGLWSPMTLRAHRPTLEFVQKAFKDNVLVAAICHAPWILISADVVKGRKIACPSDMAADVTNAGGIYVKDRCVRDGNLITAVYFGYLPDHFRMLMPAIADKIRKYEKPK